MNFDCVIRGDGNEIMSIYSGVCWIYTARHCVHLRYPCISVKPTSLLDDILDRAYLRCTWRRRSSELTDAFGGRDWVSMDMHLETEIKWTQRCTWRPGLSEVGDPFGSHDRVNLQAVIKRVWRYTSRPWSSEFGHGFARYDRWGLEEYLEAVDLEGGAMATETLFIG